MEIARLFHTSDDRAQNIRTISCLNIDFSEKSRETPPKISLRRTSLAAFCPAREQPFCSPISRRYRTHDGTCNNGRKGRWGSAQMPFNRFQPPAYKDSIEELRESVLGGPSPRLISLFVHGSKESEAPVTLMLAQWGQFIDHDLTATLQPRSVNGSVPQCCGVSELHPNCAPIRVPSDDPWLAPLGIRCLEFLRSAPAQRRDCLLSWREQTNQVTSFLDGSTIYSSSERSSERSRLFTNGLLLFGRGPPKDDVCLRGAIDNPCIRTGDTRSGEQPGLLAMHHSWVLEHNRIAGELADMNLHWSDEKIYQETRRIIGAMVQHITYREFLPLVLGREVCELFELELQSTGCFMQYDVRVNPTVANAFAAAAFRFGHSLIQSTYMRGTRNHEFLDNNVTLHEENSRGDIGSPGSLHRLLRGLSIQRAQKRDEFITAELTNHLFQSGSFPFGLDLAAINIRRGRDHGLPAYTTWREPCGLAPMFKNFIWNDLERVVGPKSARRMQLAYKSVDDIDLFVGGLAERPVVGGLIGPVFACIIAQQFSNLRKGDRFWYENGDFESSFTPAQLQSIRQVNLAQVICRTLGSGTLQPHIFLPHTVSTNERLLCGTGSLTSIDLRPWLERDPFLKNTQRFNKSVINDDDSRTTVVPIIQATNEKIIIRLDSLPSNTPTIDAQHQQVDRKFSVNATIIDNKLDLDITRSHSNSNRLSNQSTFNSDTGQKTHTIRLKNKKSKRTTTTTTTTTTTKRPHTTKRKKKRTNKNSNRRHKQKRDITDITDDNVVKARSSIVIKFDKDTEDFVTTKTPFNELNNKRRIDKGHAGNLANKEYVIVTPDQNAYDIEIKIKHKQPQRINEKNSNDTNEPDNYYSNNVKTTTKRPLHFYQVAQPSLSTTTPTSKLTTRRPYIYNIEQDEQTSKPYYTTKRPYFGYNSNKPDFVNDDKPFYSYPSVQNTDDSSYYASTNADNTNDEFVSVIKNSKPYQVKPQYNTLYLERPSGTVSPLPNDNYGQLDDEKPIKEPIGQQTHINVQQTDYGPTYLDDFVTKPPDKLTTTYFVHSDDEEFEDQNGYGPFTTMHPHDLTTFYTVQTTKKRKQTIRTRRPTRPAMPMRPGLIYQNDDDDGESDQSDDDSSDDDDDDDDDDSIGYFNPSSELSNIVSTFNGYFGSTKRTTTTTTRKPYITQQDEDFYIKPSVATDDFPYSRHRIITRNIEIVKKDRLKRVARSSDLNDDYEQITYPAALNLDLNVDIPDDTKDIAFDRDGYLRPEYMNYGLSPATTSNINKKLYNSIVDIRPTHMTHTNASDAYQEAFGNFRKYHLHSGHFHNSARHHKQITTLTTDNDRNNAQSIHNGALPTIRPFGLVPLNVLTKPERPDNWVMYDAEHKAPLPRMPQLKTEHEEESKEMPRPIIVRRISPAA